MRHGCTTVSGYTRNVAVNGSRTRAPDPPDRSPFDLAGCLAPGNWRRQTLAVVAFMAGSTTRKTPKAPTDCTDEAPRYDPPRCLGRYRRPLPDRPGAGSDRSSPVAGSAGAALTNAAGDGQSRHFCPRLPIDDRSTLGRLSARRGKIAGLAGGSVRWRCGDDRR